MEYPEIKIVARQRFYFNPVFGCLVFLVNIGLLTKNKAASIAAVHLYKYEVK